MRTPRRLRRPRAITRRTRQWFTVAGQLEARERVWKDYEDEQRAYRYEFGALIAFIGLLIAGAIWLTIDPAHPQMISDWWHNRPTL